MSARAQEINLIWKFALIAHHARPALFHPAYPAPHPALPILPHPAPPHLTQPRPIPPHPALPRPALPLPSPSPSAGMMS